MRTKRLVMVVAVGLLAGLVSILAMRYYQQTVVRAAFANNENGEVAERGALDVAIAAHEGLIEATTESLRLTKDPAKRELLEKQLAQGRYRLAQAKERLEKLQP